jgi:hypothetical protein
VERDLLRLQRDVAVDPLHEHGPEDEQGADGHDHDRERRDVVLQEVRGGCAGPARSRGRRVPRRGHSDQGQEGQQAADR